MGKLQHKDIVLRTAKFVQDFWSQLKEVRVKLPSQRDESTEMILTSDTTVSLTVSQTTLSFKNSLERLTELTETYYTHGYGLLEGKNTN